MPIPRRKQAILCVLLVALLLVSGCSLSIPYRIELDSQNISLSEEWTALAKQHDLDTDRLMLKDLIIRINGDGMITSFYLDCYQITGKNSYVNFLLELNDNQTFTCSKIIMAEPIAEGILLEKLFQQIDDLGGLGTFRGNFTQDIAMMSSSVYGEFVFSAADGHEIKMLEEDGFVDIDYCTVDMGKHCVSLAVWDDTNPDKDVVYILPQIERDLTSAKLLSK